MMFKILCSATILLVSISSCNSNQQKDSEKVASQTNERREDSSIAAEHIKDDSKFVVKATSGVSMEVELGKYASEHAVSGSVREFGKMMLADHSRDKQVLTKLAAEKNITIPGVTGEDFQKHIDDITGRQGADFDKAYIGFMIDDHKEDISEFEDEVKNGKDADIKAFATKGIPVLKHHLEMANALNDKLK